MIFVNHNQRFECWCNQWFECCWIQRFIVVSSNGFEFYCYNDLYSVDNNDFAEFFTMITVLGWYNDPKWHDTTNFLELLQRFMLTMICDNGYNGFGMLIYNDLKIQWLFVHLQWFLTYNDLTYTRYNDINFNHTTIFILLLATIKSLLATPKIIVKGQIVGRETPPLGCSKNLL